MGITREKKEKIVSEIKTDLSRAKAAIVTDYRGLNVEQITSLRRALRAEKVKYMVVKNTLAKRAAQELGITGLDAYLEGPTAIAYGFEDPVAPAKILTKFAKEFEFLKLKGGLLEGALMDTAMIKTLADLPSREVLLAKLAGAFAAPMTGFAGAAQALLRKFVATLDAVREKKAAEA
ncbi:MAG: 50S ribosomal protein L10 [Firmicutes bacterium]|nr:50S ribosomal protein L10 [Bacillota bacterium]